jgi:hypothetical protein
LKSPEIRPATKADLKAFKGELPKGSLRCLVADLDGRILGVGGLCYSAGTISVFSIMRDEMKPYRRTILKASRLLAEMARECSATAIADDKHKNSRRLLTRLGFVSFGPTQYGEVFGWVK